MTDEKRLAARQWRAKADNDWATVEILLESERCPADSVCFHCQQYVEKLLKALLTANGIECPRTHDIRRLVGLAEPLAVELSLLTEASDMLTEHGVRTRYPDEYREIAGDELKEVVDLAREFGRILRAKLRG
jgi:HEPN domain-containing protein